MHEGSNLAAIVGDKGGAVFTVVPSATVRRAIEEMNGHSVGCVIVMGQEDVVGIFTERDVLRRVVLQGGDLDETRVADVMTRDVITVPPTTTVAQAMTVMTQRRIRHLPIMEGKKIVGIVSIGDLTRWSVRDREEEINHLVAYIEGEYPR